MMTKKLGTLVSKQSLCISSNTWFHSAVLVVSSSICVFRS